CSSSKASFSASLSRYVRGVFIQRLNHNPGRQPTDFANPVSNYDAVTPEQIASLYRLRWKIELAFKRLKSLLGIDELPAKDPDLARSWLSAKLLTALLIDTDTCNLSETLPSAQ
uniref:transposase n=1 Tax=Rhodospirillum sp. A1_3_36 TaxID=3391666 RepID=UPI0039A68DDF